MKEDLRWLILLPKLTLTSMTRYVRGTKTKKLPTDVLISS